MYCNFVVDFVELDTLLNSSVLNLIPLNVGKNDCRISSIDSTFVIICSLDYTQSVGFRPQRIIRSEGRFHTILSSALSSFSGKQEIIVNVNHLSVSPHKKGENHENILVLRLQTLTRTIQINPAVLVQ